MDISIATPKGYEPDAEIVNEALEIAAVTGSKITLSNDPLVAAQDADVLILDVWASMGRETEQNVRKIALPVIKLISKSWMQPKVMLSYCIAYHSTAGKKLQTML